MYFKTISTTVFLLSFLLVSANVSAQRGIPGPNTPDKNHTHGDTNPAGRPDNSPNKQNAPLDGGLSILLGAGAVYGIKKAYDKRKKTAQNKISSEAE